MPFDVATRPVAVKIVVWAVLLIGVINGWRLAGLWQEWDLLAEYGAQLPAFIRILIAGIWLILLPLLALKLFNRQRKMRQLIPFWLTIYALSQLFSMAILTTTHSATQGWLVRLFGYIVGILLTSFILNHYPSYWRPRSQNIEQT